MKIAAVQMDIRLADKESNLAQMVTRMQAAAQQGARLVAFPECALTGYCFDSLEEALPFGEPIPGPSTESMTKICRETGCYAVYGLLEFERSDNRLFNACVLVGPHGVIGSYRKVHLPYLGVDRFTTPGDRPFRVHGADDVRIGMNICYDGSFPEVARILALEGADAIILPTNWPPGSECMARHVVCARAMENIVYYVTINRIGVERGFRFIGESRICAPDGMVIAEAGPQDDTILYAEVDPERARRKRIVRVPEKHIIDRFADRRPEMYGPIVEQAEYPRT